MDTLDELLNLKRLRENPAFSAHLLIYEKRVDRLKAKIFNADTPDEEAQRLRWAVIHLNTLHPGKILDSEIKAMESKIEKAHERHNTK